MRNDLLSLALTVVATSAAITGTLGGGVVVSAADGVLDPSWGGNGIVVHGASATINAAFGVAVQCDGKVVTTGFIDAVAEDAELAVVRFNTDGTLDSSFGSGGVFSLDLGYYPDIGADVAIQSDGKIVVAGSTFSGLGDWYFLVLRLNQDGTLDPTFSGDGYHIFEFGDDSQAHALAIQDDGGIVVAGETANTTGMAVARLTPAGTLDTTFATTGMAIFDFTLGDDAAWDLAIQDDGRILVAGTAAVGGGAVVAVLRLLSDGSLDASFGSGGGGAAALDFGVTSEGRGLALQSDGKIVVAGFTDTGSAVAVGRLTADGLLDTTFDADGMLVRDFGGGVDQGLDVAVQLDGKIVVAGGAESSGVENGVVMRFDSDGGPDLGFGVNAASTLGFGFDSVYSAVALQPGDGRIIGAGETEYSSTDSRILLVRIIGDDSRLFSSTFECGNTSDWSFATP
jgi:uncharacterized delta-60 repeat protein